MKHDSISGFLEQRMDGYLALLKRWVETNSHTINKTGVNKHGQDVAEAFSRLGFKARFVTSVNPELGDHLVLTCGRADAPAIGLISHLDTVFSAEEEQRNNFCWRAAEGNIYGPGTVDIKGGTLAIYMLLDALATLSPELFDSARWVVLLDSAEEVAAPDFAGICREELGFNKEAGIAPALAALVFETGDWNRNRFTLVTARKGRLTGRIKITGRAAHAGICPEKGASAVRQLARTIEALEGLNDYQSGLSVNVGFCTGGTEPNTVAESAELKFEMRAATADALARAIAAAEVIVSRSTVAPALDSTALCKQILEKNTPLPVWQKNAATTKLFEIWRSAAVRLGSDVIEQHRGGGSDANPIAEEIATLDGLGPAGANLHCSRNVPEEGIEQEYVHVPSLVPKTVLNFLAIVELLRQN